MKARAANLVQGDISRALLCKRMRNHAHQPHTFLVGHRGLTFLEKSHADKEQRYFCAAEIVPFSAKLVHNWPRLPLKQRILLAASIANLALNTLGSLWNPSPESQTNVVFLQEKQRMWLTPLLKISPEPPRKTEFIDFGNHLLALGVLLLEIFTLQPLDHQSADHDTTPEHVRNLALTRCSNTSWDVSDLFRQAVTACLRAGNPAAATPVEMTGPAFVRLMLDQVLSPLETEMRCCWGQRDPSHTLSELFVDDMPIWNFFEPDKDVLELTEKRDFAHGQSEYAEGQQRNAADGETLIAR